MAGDIYYRGMENSYKFILPSPYRITHIDLHILFI